MSRITARSVSGNARSNGDPSKQEQAMRQVELDGVVEAAGAFHAGDEMAVEIYEIPASVVHSPS